MVEDDNKGVKGDIRFVAGYYELKIRKEETPLTLKHRKVYNTQNDNWFLFHIEVTGIIGHSGVYIHAGNDEDDTEMCLLPNDTINNNGIDTEIKIGSRSTQAVKRWYKKVYPVLESGVRCFIEVRDETALK